MALANGFDHFKMSYLLQLIPEYRPYVWSGHRLRPGSERTAEAWGVYEHDRIVESHGARGMPVLRQGQYVDLVQLWMSQNSVR
jgi:hypothetical protein